MSYFETKAYNAASRSAREIVATVADGIHYEIQSGDITDDESLSNALHTAVDSALTYTVTYWVCAWGLPDSDQGLSDGAADFDKALACKAYENLLGAVQDRFGEGFQEAMAVAADKREEKGSES